MLQLESSETKSLSDGDLEIRKQNDAPRLIEKGLN